MGASSTSTTTTHLPIHSHAPQLLPLLLTAAFPVQAMHEGVVRDMEQQRIKRERQLDFDMQRALEAEFKQHQSVRDSTSDSDTSETPAPR